MVGMAPEVGVGVGMETVGMEVGLGVDVGNIGWAVEAGIEVTFTDAELVVFDGRLGGEAVGVSVAAVFWV